ncbi:MAG: OB-fold nucleic acid binding domain-containing protein [Nanoarchaeota archaeon]|nr:OB-fold nucleic acid binding domain-containing protein [Nanoarchaeota archaeon]
MEEKTLLKIALICSIVGIFIVLIFADRLEPPLVKVSDISSSLVEKDVRISGEIVSVRSASSATIFDVKEDGSVVKVVAFDNKGVILGKGSLVEVTGKVTEYKGSLELEAKSIRLISGNG